MATEEQKLASGAEGVELQDKASAVNSAELLQSSLSGLDKFGGFQLLKGLVKGVENMDPRRKAIKNVFLNDNAYEDARKRLRNELSLWVEILEAGGKDPMDIIESCKEKCQKAERNLSENLFCIHDEIRNTRDFMSVLLVYGVKDNIKGIYTDPKSTICGQPWDKFIQASGLTPSKVHG